MTPCVHCDTLPCMSNSPRSFGFNDPHGCDWPNELRQQKSCASFFCVFAYLNIRRPDVKSICRPLGAMVSMIPFLCPLLSRRGKAFLPFGQELLEFLLQMIDDRGRLIGAISQNEPDEIEDIPATPFFRR